MATKKKTPLAVLNALHKGFHKSGHTECQILADMLEEHIGNETIEKGKKLDKGSLDLLDTMLAEVITNARAMRQELNSLAGPRDPRHGFLCPEEVTLECAHQEGPPIKAKVSVHAAGIFVSFQDHGVCTEDDAECVLVEQIKGEPRVIVWSDINQEDPTHIVEMHGACHDHQVER
jgi:hypothetical protein